MSENYFFCKKDGVQRAKEVCRRGTCKHPTCEYREQSGNIPPHPVNGVLPGMALEFGDGGHGDSGREKLLSSQKHHRTKRGIKSLRSNKIRNT